MACFYIYFISSLPMLHLGMKPPFSQEHFLELSRQFIPAEDYAILAHLPAAEGYENFPTKQATLQRWVAFDTALKNELVKLRASRKRMEPTKYLRPGQYSDVLLAQIALNASRNPAPPEAERFLDQQRWNFLEELAFGHYFDLDVLILYAYKLKILWRWEEVRLADKEALLEKVLT